MYQSFSPSGDSLDFFYRKVSFGRLGLTDTNDNSKEFVVHDGRL